MTNIKRYIEEHTEVTHMKGQWTTASPTYPVEEYELNGDYHTCRITAVQGVLHLIAVTQRDGTTHMSLDFNVAVEYSNGQSQIVPASTVKDFTLPRSERRRLAPMALLMHCLNVHGEIVKENKV